MPITLSRILPAVERMRLGGEGQRGITYLLTYPSFLALAKQSPIDEALFHQLAGAAYGWMPRILRIDGNYVRSGLDVLRAAREAKLQTNAGINVEPLARCVYSLVGASKLLHFINPEVFPIWDSNVEAFRHENKTLPYNHMRDAKSYLGYASEVARTAEEQGFRDFYANLSDAHLGRLAHHGIHNYRISPVRAVELAAFVLSP